MCCPLLQYRAVVTLRSLISCLMLLRRSEMWFASIITLISSQFQAARFWEGFVVSCLHLNALRRVCKALISVMMYRSANFLCKAGRLAEENEFDLAV